MSLFRDSVANNNNNNHVSDAHVRGSAKETKATAKRPRVNDQKTFLDADQKEICRWAFVAEKIMHGNPSGKRVSQHCSVY